jgi:hypothetical protein
MGGIRRLVGGLREILEKREYPVGTRRVWRTGVFVKQIDGSWKKLSSGRRPARQGEPEQARTLDVDTGEIHDDPVLPPPEEAQPPTVDADDQSDHIAEFKHAMRTDARRQDMRAPDAMAEREYWEVMAAISDELVAKLVKRPHPEVLRELTDLHGRLLGRGLPEFPVTIDVERSAAKLLAGKEQELGERLGRFASLVGGGSLGPLRAGAVRFVSERDRAQFDPRTGVLDLGKRLPDDALVFHEMGHWLEHHNGRIADAGWHFFQARTQGSGQHFGRPVGESLAATGVYGFEPGEVTYRDNFYHPYVGKLHQASRGSEVVASGLEMWTSPWSMLLHLKRDPEHFALIYGIATGRFGYRP